MKNNFHFLIQLLSGLKELTKRNYCAITTIRIFNEKYFVFRMSVDFMAPQQKIGIDFRGKNKKSNSKHPHQSAAPHTVSSALTRTLPALARPLSSKFPSAARLIVRRDISRVKSNLTRVVVHKNQPWPYCVSLQACWLQLPLLLRAMRLRMSAVETPRYRTSNFKQVCKLGFLSFTQYKQWRHVVFTLSVRIISLKVVCLLRCKCSICLCHLETNPNY